MTLTKDEALAALRALYATKAYHNAATAEAGKYVKHTGIVPEWLVAMTAATDKWKVLNGGVVYETTAKSRADAINNVRFNIYGRVPESECGEFDAICPAFVILQATGDRRRGIKQRAERDLFGHKIIRKEDAMARIRRMAR